MFLWLSSVLDHCGGFFYFFVFEPPAGTALRAWVDYLYQKPSTLSSSIFDTWHRPLETEVATTPATTAPNLEGEMQQQVERWLGANGYGLYNMS